MLSTSLTIVAVTSEVEDEIKVREVEIIHEVVEKLGCYHSVSVYNFLIKEDGVGKMGEQLCVDLDRDEEEIEDVVLDDERDRHWRMFLRGKMERLVGRRHFYMQENGMSIILRMRR